MRLIIFLILTFFTLNSSFAQKENSLEKLRHAYSSFNYDEVVSLGKQYLNSGEEYSNEEKIEIHKMMGLANYSLNQMEEARKCFIELLKIDKNLQLNPTLIPPKIIAFFNNIREDYQQLVPEAEIEKPDSSINVLENKNTSIDTYRQSMSDQKIAMTQSFLLPGLGHIYSRQKTKGWLLTVGSAGLLGSIVYTYIETNNREEAYLSETDLNLIRSKYDRYNSMYKTRNILIGAYAAVWLYAQIDLLLFNDELPDDIFTIQNSNYTKDVSLSFNISLW